MTRKHLVIVFACLMAVSMVAPFAAAAPTTAGVAATSTDTLSQSQQPSSLDASIHPTLQQAEGTTEVVVRLDTANVPLSASQADAVSTMQSHAEATQRDVIAYAKRTEGVELLNRFWIANAVLLEVDKSQVQLQSVARMQNVDRLHPNFELTLPESVEADSQDTGTSAAAPRPGGTDFDTTYGLDQVNATEVWSSYGTQGDGVKVAVLDTGVDPDHPDIDLYTEDPNDPTYPGGWAEFDGSGNIVPGSEPHDSDYHGTHVSGTVAGGNASGEWIGVAPNVDMMHGLVIPGGGGSFAQVAAGMQWATNQSADVISMSLGATGYFTEMIEPTRNANAAGTLVVAASGNDYEGTSGSPGNVYEAVAIGASDENANIAGFSSGEVVDTAADWGSSAPSEWPDTYVVPDVAAPGVAIKSAAPGGGYQNLDGTSMATPHAAGVVALMLSAAGGDLPVGTVKSALYDTAWKPAGEPAGNDTRYGSGILDALAATDQVALDSGVVGTVTDDSGSPIADATVSASTGYSVTTDSQGNYTLLAQPGTIDVTVEKFGYESETATVTVTNGSFASQDFSLDPSLGVELTSGQPGGVEAGDDVSVTFDVTTLDSVTVDMAGNYSAANATLSIDGQEASFGDSFDFDSPYTGELTITVTTSEAEAGDLSLSHTFSGAGDSVSMTTGPTTVFEEYVKVGIVTDDNEHGDSVLTTLSEELPAQFDFELLTSQEAIDSASQYDGLVVQELDGANAQALHDATVSPQIGVVWLDQWGGDSNGIEARSDAVGDPANTDDDGFGSLPVVFEVTQAHDIFDGVAQPGDSVEVHTGTWGDHTWFSDTDGTVIADVGDADGTKGSAISVDEDTMTILASSLGYTSFVGGAEYTDDADQIFANAVAFAATGGPEPVGVLDLTDVRAQPNATGTMTLETTAPGVAGYQVNVSFDPSVVQVEDVHGQDFADPVVNVDNEAGWVSFAQAQASGADSPTLAEIDLTMVGERGDNTTLTFGGDTLLTFENGTDVMVSYDPGYVEVASCTAGDVNMDDELTVQDATLVQRYIVGAPINGPFNEACADMNGDGVVTSADVTQILQIVVGIGQPSVAAPAAAPAGA